MQLAHLSYLEMSLDTNNVDLKAWVGRKRTERDIVEPRQVRGMAALLDRDPEQYSAGTVLPEFWHWIYFNPAVPRSRLGEDGHELRGDFFPPVELPRRMWAGGRLRFLRSMVIGEEIERVSEILSIEAKHGRSGDLVLVTVRYVISDKTGVCVEEEQDIVYCEIPKSPSSPQPQAALPDDLEWRDTFLPDAVVLFRYSALMFNAHRIHYDYPFTTKVEGYRGLIVHGPLTATLLLDAAKRKVAGTLTSFEYRGIAPLFNDEPITLAGRSSAAGHDTELWAAGPSGAIAMRGRVTWA
jgi:3-methylfumaryl-CoA hydratase